MQTYEPTADDLALEAQLREAITGYEKAQTVSEKRMIWRRIQALHGRRSPEMVRYLEWQKGLAR